MKNRTTTGFSRRSFLAGIGVGAGGVVLTQYALRRATAPDMQVTGPPPALEREPEVAYGDYRDVYRKKWTWDRVAKGTHTRANCMAACSFDVFVKDGICWREEQHAIYESPRPDVPDPNPRGCQKGCCYTDLQVASSRVLHPLKRVGERGEGKWQRISWEQACNEIADHIIDAAIEQGTESILHDHGTTNAGYGPETSGEIRYTEAVGATVIDSWSGVGDMPMGAVQTWGMYNCEGTAADWFKSDYIIVWIGNPSYTRIPEVHYMHEARYRGAKLVVVSPDYNATCVHADMWINLKAETDAALGLAAARVIIEEGLHDEEYVREQTDLPILVRTDTKRFLRQPDIKGKGRANQLYFWDEAKQKLAEVPGCEDDGDGGRSLELGSIRPALTGKYSVKLADGSTVEVEPVFEGLRRQLDDYTLEKAGQITGLNPSLIHRFAQEMAKAPSAMIFASWGACKHHHSDLFQRAMILLMALTGNQGKSGGGLRVAAWWGMDGLDRLITTKLSAREMMKAIPKAIRGLTVRDYEQFYIEHSEKQPNAPLMPFLYVHGGYKELWDRPDLADPAVPRKLAEYMRDSLDRGWTHLHPKEDREPRVLIFSGSNPLRRWPAPQIAEKHLWPKLKCIVSVNFRMSTTGLAADYVLPAAGYYEKHGIKYAQSYIPYVVVSDEAVKPLGESKSEWVVFGRLCEAVARRAKQRNVGPVRGYRDEPHDLTKAYDTYTSHGHYDPEDPKDPIRLMDDIFRNSPSVGSIGAEEALRLGAVPITGNARPSPIYQTSSDFDPKDTFWPHQWMVDGKMAWPTLTGRQQFYIDHPWYLEVGEALPVHKDPPGINSKYPLRINGGHTRWSIHAIWRDLEALLRLQRGEPVCFLNPTDCASRGIDDGSMVKVFNETGDFTAMSKVAPGVQPGEVIVYHAWEPFQFKGRKGPQEPVQAPWKALHLAGGLGQIHYRMFYGSPSHSPRGAPVDVQLA